MNDKYSISASMKDDSTVIQNVMRSVFVNAITYGQLNFLSMKLKK